MRSTVLLFLMLVVLSTLNTGFSQELRKKYADEEFNLLRYYFASEGYEDYIDRKKGDSIDVVPNIAISYDKIGNVEKAVAWYKYMDSKDVLDQEGLYRLGLLQRELKDYTGSVSSLNRYESLYGSTDVTQEILSSAQENLTALQTKSDNFDVSGLNISTSASDFGVSFFKEGKVVVTNSKRDLLPLKRVHGWTGGHYYNLYLGSQYENGDISELEQINGDNKTKYHETSISYDSINDKVYFTRNNFNEGVAYDSNKEVRIKIYQAQLDGEEFTNIVELPFNSNDYSCAHPSISGDGKRLYFVSDMPGGLGGSDIYYVNIEESDAFSSPVNMGPKVNTSLNEITPYIHPKENILFFSSNGRFGLGGQDVYYTQIDKNGEATMVMNIGSEINSERDDFSFVNNTAQTLGYFSSNRDGGVDNLYKFRQEHPVPTTKILSGTVYDLATNNTLPNISVEIYAVSNELLGTVVSDENGHYEFEYEPEIQLDSIKVAETPLYYAYSKEVTSDEEDVYLETKRISLDGLVVDSRTGEGLSGALVTIINNSTGDSVVQMNTNNMGEIEKYLLDITSEQDVDLTVNVEKEGYAPRIMDVNNDMLAGHHINLNLDMISEKDLNAMLALKPIYFDFDKSNIRPDAEIELKKVIEWMKSNPSKRVYLASHTDIRGSDAYNKRLSIRRAKSTKNYMVKHGVSKDRLEYEGFGSGKPKIDHNKIAQEPNRRERERMHQLNRRTEFSILE